MTKKLLGIVLAIALCAGLAFPVLAVGTNVAPGASGGEETIEIVEGVCIIHSDQRGHLSISNAYGVVTYVDVYGTERTAIYATTPTTVTILEDAYGENLGAYCYKTTLDENGDIDWDSDWTQMEIAQGTEHEHEYLDDLFFDAGATYVLETGVYYLPAGPMIEAGIVLFVSDSETPPPEPPEPPQQPADEPAGAPSGWAAEEVAAAIEAGLVPEGLQKDYQSDVSRGSVAQMFINLIEQASGQTIDEFMEAKGVTINNNAFTDTSDRAVLAANALGIINGLGDGKFGPDGTLTRAQIAAIINRVASVMGVETEGYSHEFTDVEGHWVSDELGWPVHAGIINGYDDGTFRPNVNLNTEQAIAITYRALAPLQE